MASDLSKRKQRRVHKTRTGQVVKRPRFGYCTDDIIIQILSRLPTKTLYRFNCVCKSWSDFSKKELNRRLGIRILVSCQAGRKDVPPVSLDYETLAASKKTIKKNSSYHDFSGIFGHNKIQIIGSCNGLICLANAGGLHLDPDILLWNPSTRAKFKLPKHPLTIFHGWSLWFDGFGYDSTSEDYKVVLGYKERSDHPLKTAVFTRKRGSWWVYNDVIRAHPPHTNGCFFNGALHWVSDVTQNARIISFDLDSEEFRQDLVELSDSMMNPLNRHGSVRLGTLRNCLSLFSHLESTSTLTLWMMKEYKDKESWIKFMKIPLGIGGVQSLGRDIVPKSILENGSILFIQRRFTSIVELDTVMGIYDPERRSFKTVVQAPGWWSYQATLYRETTVSPESVEINEVGEAAHKEHVGRQMSLRQLKKMLNNVDN